MSVESDLRTKLLADFASYIDADNGLSVSYNQTDEEAPKTRIFFQRSGTENENLLGGSTVIYHAIYDVECVSDDPATAIAMGDALQAYVTFAGAMGDTAVLAMDVTDQSSEYVPYHDYADEGLHVTPLRLEVMF